MKIVFFTNCQGIILNEILKYSNTYKKTITEYEWINKISDCDIFIYQPLKLNDGRNLFYNTWDNSGALQYLKKSCKKICFPCLYSDCFPIVSDGNRYIGQEYIHQLIQQGLSLDEILKLYINKQLTFNLEERYNKSIEKLKENEKICDIKISEILVDFQKQYNLFYTHNHPKEILLGVIANCILIKLNMNDVIDIFSMDKCLYENTSVWPLDASMKNIGFKYITNTEPCHLYINNIIDVFKKYNDLNMK